MKKENNICSVCLQPVYILRSSEAYDVCFRFIFYFTLIHSLPPLLIQWNIQLKQSIVSIFMILYSIFD